MAFYRLYRLNEFLVATGPMSTLELDSDDEAIGRAMTLAASGCGAEIWWGPRLVHRVPAPEPASA